MNDTGFDSKKTASKKEGGQEGSSFSEVLDFLKNLSKPGSKSPSGSPNHSPSGSINLSQTSVTMQARKNNTNSFSTSTEDSSISRKTKLEMLHSYFVSSYPMVKQQSINSTSTTVETASSSKTPSLTQPQTTEKDKENEDSPTASPKQGNRLSRKKQQIMKWNRPEKEVKEKEPPLLEKEDEKLVVTEKDPLKHEIQKMRLLLDSLSCRIDQDAEVVDIIQKDIERLQRRRNITTTFMGGTKKRLEALEEQLTNLERQVQAFTGQLDISTMSVQELNDITSKLAKAYSQLTVAHSTQCTKPPQPQREPVQKEIASFSPSITRKASLKSSSHVAFELPSAEEEILASENGSATDIYKDMDVKQISGELLSSAECITRLVEKQRTKKRELEEERRKLNSEISQLERTKVELESSINRKNLQITENESLIAKLSGSFDYNTLSVAELAELLNIVSSSQRRFSGYV